MTQETGVAGSGGSMAGGSSGTETVQQSASKLADQAGRTAEAQASKYMTQAGDSLEQVARVVREAGEGVRQDQPAIADMAENAAEQVERAAQFLREHDAAEVVEAGSNYARRQPALLLGGGLLLGLALGRVLKTAGRHPDGGGAHMGAYGTGAGRYDASTPGYGAASGGYGVASGGYGQGTSMGAAGGMGASGGAGAMDTTDPLVTGAVVVDEETSEIAPDTSSRSAGSGTSARES